MRQPRITIVLPVYKRPERTRRMIECILNQNINNWEAIIIGDRCPHFIQMNEELFPREVQKKVIIDNRNMVTSINAANHYGGYGYYAINRAIEWAKGKYFIFAGNDDIIKPNHFEHYLSGIEGTDLDFVYYNTFVHPHNMLRMSQPLFGSIGHSELIIRTEFLKQMPPHSPAYGHDWELVENMLKATDKHKKIPGENPTYYIMSVPGKTLDTID